MANSESAALQFEATAAVTGPPTIPATPSVIITIFKID
jgi:hypothetical protein